MKWNSPRNDDTKIITKFLFFPVTACVYVYDKDKHYDKQEWETRWLSNETIEYEFIACEKPWNAIRFVDE